jgi:hypothetical protein
MDGASCGGFGEVVRIGKAPALRLDFGELDHQSCIAVAVVATLIHVAAYKSSSLM